MTTAAPKHPATTAEVRRWLWKSVRILRDGAATAISHAEDDADNYAKADEAVRYLQSAADQARVVRDSLAQPTQPDQFAGLQKWTKDMLDSLTDAFRTVRKEQADHSKNIAEAVVARLEGMRELDAKAVTRAVLDEAAKMRMEKRA